MSQHRTRMYVGASVQWFFPSFFCCILMPHSPAGGHHAGGPVFDRALRCCAAPSAPHGRAPRPKSRRPGEVGKLPELHALSFVRGGGARPPPLAHQMRRTGRGCAPRALGARRRAADPLGQLHRQSKANGLRAYRGKLHRGSGAL
jgi:hypothetical protein